MGIGLFIISDLSMASSLGDCTLLLGDPITQQAYDPSISGWAASLTNAYINKLVVINHGLSGYNTDQALQLIPSILLSPSCTRIRILVVFFGANDARLPDGDGPQQHVPLDKYCQNLKNIVAHERVMEHEGVKVVLVTPPPIDEHALLKQKMGTRKAEVTREYASAVKCLAEELRIPCLDIWGIFMREAGWKTGEMLMGSLSVEKNGLPKLLRDGLHPTSAGNKLVFTGLMDLIAAQWPGLLPEKLKPTFIPWWEFDVAHTGEGTSRFANIGSDV